MIQFVYKKASSVLVLIEIKHTLPCYAFFITWTIICDCQPFNGHFIYICMQGCQNGLNISRAFALKRTQYINITIVSYKQMTYANMDCKESIRLNSRARKNGTIYVSKQNKNYMLKPHSHATDNLHARKLYRLKPHYIISTYKYTQTHTLPLKFK